jgi:hypothetical protein
MPGKELVASYQATHSTAPDSIPCIAARAPPVQPPSNQPSKYPILNSQTAHNLAAGCFPEQAASSSSDTHQSAGGAGSGGGSGGGGEAGGSSGGGMLTGEVYAMQLDRLAHRPGGREQGGRETLADKVGGLRLGRRWFWVAGWVGLGGVDGWARCADWFG